MECLIAGGHDPNDFVKRSGAEQQGIIQRLDNEECKTHLLAKLTEGPEEKEEIADPGRGYTPGRGIIVAKKALGAITNAGSTMASFLGLKDQPTTVQKPTGPSAGITPTEITPRVPSAQIGVKVGTVYKPKTVSSTSTYAVSNPGKSIGSTLNTIGEPSLPTKGGIGGVTVGPPDQTTSASIITGSSGPGGFAKVASKPKGLDVNVGVDEEGNVDVDITPNKDYDPDSEDDTISIDYTDPDGGVNYYDFYTDDYGAPKAPRSGAEKASIWVLVLLLITLGVLSWKYYKERE